MAQFRKKPVVIEAMQWDGSPHGASQIVQWSGGKVSTRVLGVTDDRKALNVGMFVETLEGVMRAGDGDWIIRGVKGEFYPCKPDIFAATYEPADG